MSFHSILTPKPKYESVDTSNDVEDTAQKLPWKQRQGRLRTLTTRVSSFWKKELSLVGAIYWTVISALLVALAHAHITKPPNATIVYTPVNNIIEYQEQVFTHQTNPKYIGPVGDPEIDVAWEDLYSAGIDVELTESEAKKLPNNTWPVTQKPGKYHASLHVFHSLHCLDTLRKFLHPDVYDAKALKSLGHIPHCFDILRESIMCTSDTSVIVWQWIPEDRKAKQMSNTAHTCRNFEKIREWAEDRRTDVIFDETTDHTSNPLAGIWNEPLDSNSDQNQVSWF